MKENFAYKTYLLFLNNGPSCSCKGKREGKEVESETDLAPVTKGHWSLSESEGISLVDKMIT